MAHVDQFILQNVFGCNVELVPGDTMATGTSMVEKGEPDIAPEMWSNSMRQAFDKGVEEKRLRYAGNSLSEGGEEGFWVPKYMVEKDPGLKTIKGIKKKSAIFKHPEDSNLSAFYGCPAGWNCQINSGNLFRALELEEFLLQPVIYHKQAKIFKPIFQRPALNSTFPDIDWGTNLHF
ncbi:glycine betaine ABC transporter substrate-binding protein [Endozoicomonas sp. YOMI1]|uniref:glycine betaine ABC transporter substrate-binding protein n=1 Tax=Endozoicomonas sp. YOMI1 TaxID=2828739 RepID=UPI0021474E7A|nr:glycine betaine ABC transporter substrate-binding protein [Endozoicomonas sp. YOMI1]